MALTTVKVQGADGDSEEVLLDTITNQIYAMPIYKLAIGVVGTDDGVVSSSNPLPITGSVFDDRSVVSLLKLQIIVLGKIERQLAIMTEEDVDENDLKIKED